MNARRRNHGRARGAVISKRVGSVKQVNGRHCLHPLQRNSKCLPVHIDNAFSLGIHVFEMMLATCSSSLRKKRSVIQNTRILISKSHCSPCFELFIRQPYLDLLIRHHLLLLLYRRKGYLGYALHRCLILLRSSYPTIYIVHAPGCCILLQTVNTLG